MRFFIRMMAVVLVCAVLAAPVFAQDEEPTGPQADLMDLVTRIKAKLGQGDVSKATFAGELEEFDALLKKYAGQKNDDVAQILFMKAILYSEVLGDTAAGMGLLQKLADEFPGTAPAERALKAVETEKIKAKLKPGNVFPDFEAKDMDGKPLSVSMYRGKVLLVDFWATWCGPCVREMPNVVKLYRNYHGKGFEIIGISLDSDKERLTGFLEDHQITWQQYFDGKGWSNELAGRYGVNSIPAMFLLDPEGKIIASRLRGKELAEAVEEAVENLAGK